MENVDITIHAGWIITVDEDNRVLKNHTLVVNQGKIVDILPSTDAQQRYQAEREHHCQSHVLFPGLINAHTHASMNLLRGYADDLALMDWLQNHIWPTEAKWVSEAFVYDGSRHAMAESIRSGVTCLNEMYFFPDQAAKAALSAGIRLSLGLIVIDFPTVWAQNADQYLEKAIAVYDQFKHENLIRFALAPHAPYTVSDEPLKRIASYAEELDLPVHMHVHETQGEVDMAVAQQGQRPLSRLRQLGLSNPRLLAVHMTALNEEEIKQCAEDGIHVIHCPESNMKLASGFCPTQALLAAGVNVALGTDGSASNNDLDMLGEMRTAGFIAKGYSGDATALEANTLLRMATINGAKALGLEETIGSLEVGKSADMVALNFNDINTTPVYNPVSHLVYAASRQQITDVWVAGKALLSQGQLTTLNENAIIENAKLWQQKISTGTDT